MNSLNKAFIDAAEAKQTGLVTEQITAAQQLIDHLFGHFISKLYDMPEDLQGEKFHLAEKTDADGRVELTLNYGTEKVLDFSLLSSEDPLVISVEAASPQQQAQVHVVDGFRATRSVYPHHWVLTADDTALAAELIGAYVGREAPHRIEEISQIIGADERQQTALEMQDAILKRRTNKALKLR